jgi:hypothetical protein
MAITLIFGKTESGKSYLADNVFIKKRKKVVIFDYAHCFENGQVFTDFSISNFEKILKKYAKKDAFKLIFRPPRKVSDEIACQLVASFSFAIGRTFGERSLKDDEKVLFVIDEADKVANYKKADLLSKVVTKGRHDNLDTLAIAQDPTTIPTFFRRNSSQIITFAIGSNPFFAEKFGHELTRKVSELEKYHSFAWKDNGETAFLNPNFKKVSK